MFELEIIKHIQMMRSPFFDAIFTGITHLGDELAFIAVAVVFYWAIDKRFGFKMINVYLIGCSVLEGVKNLVARPRPYTHEGVVSVTDPTGGYSFPSGHSHSVANLSTQISSRYRKSYVIAPLAVICVLVAFSRLYLGQHFLSDVIVGLALGVGVAIGLGTLFELLGDREEYVVLGVFPICLIILIIIVATGQAASAKKILDVTGAYSAITLGYFVEKRYVKSTTKCKWYIAIVKVVVGLALTLGVKEGMKLFIPSSAPLAYNFLRYFVVGVVASLGVPALFKAAEIVAAKVKAKKPDLPDGTEN